ncbi:MAG: lactate racemase domain-containing protein, partial [Desulfobacterales bacterium]|nr:lactate racemase domain-containing protein [Desulfobacterales bacterium]
IIALGTHRDIPAHGFAALCGEGTGSRVKVINSAGRDPDRLTHIGTTSRGTRLTVTREAWEADHIIIFGGILHHMLAGYGGGRKYILPGIAGESAIMANHALAIDRDGTPHPLVTQAVCRGNPVSEDMQEGADLFLKHKTCTYAAVVANGRGEIFHADAGELRATFEQGCGHLDGACCVDVDQKADFILFSAGGHRTDGQLYQATKALFNAVNVAKEGADLMFVAGCGQGVGNDSFAEALTAFRNRPGALGKKLADQFHMPAYVALRVIDMLTRFRITLVSDLDEATTRALGFEFTRDPRQLITGLHGKGYIIPFAENILPRKKGE